MRPVRRLFLRGDTDLRRELELLSGDQPPDTLSFDDYWIKLTEVDSPAADSLAQFCQRKNAYLAVGKTKDGSGALLGMTRQNLNELQGYVRDQRIKIPGLADLTVDQVPPPKSFTVGKRAYEREGAPFIMGILNVTPDSFSDGGSFIDPDRAVGHALQMEADGANFIDVGGESSRPGSDPVSEDEELDRVIPVIERLARELTVPVSIDTTKAAVAQAAIGAGAQIINDISALTFDPQMAQIAAQSKATVILMHMLGKPRTMQQEPFYTDLMGEIFSYLYARIEDALNAGISRSRILIDPGIGFGKRVADNLEIIGRLQELSTLAPILAGPSRKSFIGIALDLPLDERLFGTAGAVAISALKGADVIRVHDVKEMKQVLRMVDLCMTASEQ